MRKRTWLDMGIAVLGLFLVCSAAQDVAQSQGTYDDAYGLSPGTTGTGQGTGGAGQGTGTGQMTTDTEQATGTQASSSVEAVQRQEISQLRAEVDRLQRELTRMRAQLAEAGLPTQEGTGGAGSAGIGDPNAEAPAGQSGLGNPVGEGVGGSGRAGGAQAARPDTGNEGTAVANMIFTGRIRSVSQQQLVLEVDEGVSNSLPLARDVRVFRGRQQVAFNTLREGTFVRASADLYARGNPVVRIDVLPTTTQQPSQE